jgi:FkbH-like protein
MKFMEAKKIVAAFEGGPPLSFLLAASGQPEPLEPFLQAAAAEQGYEADVSTLPFNTLAQHLRTARAEGTNEVYLLFPWDLVPAADWRSGFTSGDHDLADLVDEARATLELVSRREDPPILYVAAPIPPTSIDERSARALPHLLLAAAIEAGARVLPGDSLSLDSLFRAGSPLSSHALGAVAREVVSAALGSRPPSGKVLVTDFDNTLWRGVVGEDGVEGLEYEPNGLGFPHFVYQTFLRRLKASGVLIAGVTRNDPDLARAPLDAPGSVLSPDDFVSILASYNPKSIQIRELADQLNLGLESFVFVDDNPVELEEVGRALPAVRLVEFPDGASGLPRLLASLTELFHRERLSAEDLERTEMYRRRLAGLVPKDAEGADLTDFLASLSMRLVISDRSGGDRTRAVQLINKTNQFNLNGVRRSDEEVSAILEDGGRLYTAHLSDRHGDHGEILSCLLDASGTVRSLVMSCRVFQRRVEHAFLVWLAGGAVPPRLELHFQDTERNEPFRRFLRDAAVDGANGRWTLDLAHFAAAHGPDLGLFELEAP